MSKRYITDKLNISELEYNSLGANSVLVQKEVLGDDLITLPSNGAGNVYEFTQYGTNTVTYSGTSAIITYVDNSSGAYMYLNSSYNLPSELVVGTTYFIAITFKVVGAITWQIALGSGSYSFPESTNTEFETISHQFVKAGTTVDSWIRSKNMGTGESVTVQSVVVREVESTSSEVVKRTLGSDAFISGGPYLPLSAGSSFPLTDTLYISKSTGANIILNSNTGAVSNGVYMTEGGTATPLANGARVHYDGSSNLFKVSTGTSTLTDRFTIARDTGAATFSSTIDSKTITVTAATTSPLLNLYNSTNGSGATIRFSDQNTLAQIGDITFYHSDGSSQGGGASFNFTSQPDTVLIVGDATNKGRILVSSQGSATEVDYGFFDDINTGMRRSAADTLRLTTGGTDALMIDGSQNSTFLGNLIINGYTKVVGAIRGNGQQIVLNAGESSSYATGQTAENVYINAEAGLQVVSSPDNWNTGWAGRQTAHINNAGGGSTFPGTIGSGSITSTGNITASSGTGHFSLVNASGYQLNGTYIVDSSRNLVNIGTIGSGAITSTGTGSFAEMVTIDITDISTGENRGLQLLNSSGTDQQWNITAGTVGINNDDFTVRNSTNNINTLIIDTTGAATFTGSVTADSRFVSSDTSAILSTTGAGTVYLRPVGQQSATGQVTIASTGEINVSGQIRNVTAGNTNLDAVNLQQLNNATTGVLTYKGVWAAGATGVTSAAISGTTITLTVAPVNTIAVGDIVTGEGITGLTTLVTVVGSQTSVTVSTSVTIGITETVTFSPAGGFPDLTATAKEVEGDYYITNVAGYATPNDVSTTPNEWAVGDWCIFTDADGANQWQKLDNSSTLDGAGTGGTLPLWSGTGTSVTLNDSRFTQNANENTVTAPSNLSSDNGLIVQMANGNDIIRARANGIVEIPTSYLHINNGAGIYSDGKIKARGGVTDDLGTLGLGGSDTTDNLILTSNTLATFAGDVKISGTGDPILDIYRDTGANLSIRLAGEAVSYIDNNNNFGIGTNAPGAKLDVAGGIRMADDTTAASSTNVGTQRYRVGTEYVEVDGTELVTNGNFATDTAWTKETGWSIGSGVASYNGSAANNGLYENLSLTTGSIYRLSFTIVNYVSGTLIGALSSGSATGNTPNITANGTYVFNLTATGVLCIFRSTSSFNGSIDNVSLIEVTAEDASYADMCMQVSSTEYEWVNIVSNNW